MELNQLSVLWMKWRHFLSQIQRLDSDNNGPGLTPSYNKNILTTAIIYIWVVFIFESVIFTFIYTYYIGCDSL